MVSTKTRRTEGSNFRLTKWYLDCVTVDGTVVIGYAARLHLHGMSIAVPDRGLLPDAQRRVAVRGGVIPWQPQTPVVGALRLYQWLARLAS